MKPGTNIKFDDFELLKVIGYSIDKEYLVRKRDNGQPYAMKIFKKSHLIKKNLINKIQGK